jgi:hypothetical protein
MWASRVPGYNCWFKQAMTITFIIIIMHLSLSSLFSFFRAGTCNVTDLRSRLSLLLKAELPPPDKRRRGLAGSIVSTALSAAFLGTAVGLTVYRL